MVHGEDVKGAKCAVGGADVGQRNPVVARGQHIGGLQMKRSCVGCGLACDRQHTAAQTNAEYRVPRFVGVRSPSIAHLVLPSLNHSQAYSAAEVEQEKRMTRATPSP